MDQPPLIGAPDDPREWEAWRAGLHKWRDETRAAMGYTGATYEPEEFAWMRRCFAFGKVMLFDREFVDPVKNRFNVEPWLEMMNREFGGLDALALWQAYPRIGIDSRNQYDHYREVPGGMRGLEELVDTLHRHDVKVVLAYNPWDTGTRRDPKGDAETLAEMIGAVKFDGIFLDTLTEGGANLRTAVDKQRRGVVLESELALPVSAIPIHHASWAQWFGDSYAPGVMRNRWFERRHMMHLIRRWDLDHTGELHMAWMNGAGMFIWQNIFGSWNGWSDRDKTLLRQMLPIQRYFADHFSFGEWTPLVEPGVAGVFTSKWEHKGVTLWTSVNREASKKEGFIHSESNDGSIRLYDLIRGLEVDHAHIEIEARGIGGLVAVPSSQVDDRFREFLAGQAEQFARANFAVERVERMPVRLAFAPSKKHAVPSGMKAVKAGTYPIVCRMRSRECGEYGYAEYAHATFPGLHGHRKIERVVHVGNFAVAEREVTNAEFAAFVKATGYRPASKENFLNHWQSGAPLAADLEKPVTFVDLEDARAYAHWAGLRLPTEDEWQLAVTQHKLPHGRVWNRTESEHQDGRTTFSILKGGCEWKAVGSDWYFDTGAQDADWSAKFIHFWPGMDRSETISFRCAVDL